MKTNMRAVLGWLLLGWTLVSPAADLTRSITFSDGQKLTAANLHALIDGASINTAFLTGKSLLSAVDSGDYVLVYDTSAGTFKKMTLGALLLANTDLITTQLEEGSPAAGDYLLLYDASGGTLAKVSMANLVTGNTNLIGGQAPLTNLLSTAQFLVNNGGTNARIQLQHLWAQNFEYTRAITNLTRHSAPKNTDAFLLWDSTAGTNRWATWIDLVTNTPSVGTVSNAALLSVVETNQFKNITISNLMSQFANSGTFLTTNLTFTATAACSGITGAGKPIDAAHGFATVPRYVKAVLVCTTANLNYAIGDEVGVDPTWDGWLTAPALFTFGNSTNVGVVVRNTAAGWSIANKTTGTLAAITPGSWTLKIYARP